MKRTTRATISIAILLVLYGCATGSATFTATGTTYPPHEGPVKVFWDEVPKNVEYEELGIVSGVLQASDIDWSRLIVASQKEAARNGANAIVIKKIAKDVLASNMACVAVRVKE